MTAMSRRASLLLAAAGLLGLAWLTSPMLSGPPLYDGLGFPDEPYRYVAPPSGAPRTAAPSAAFAEVSVSGGQVPLVRARSGEQGPQVEVVLRVGQLVASPEATEVRMSAEPAGPARQPGEGEIWGNVYHLAVVSDHGSVHAKTNPDDPSTISLRVPVTPQPEPEMVFNDGAGWRTIPVYRVGYDIYAGPVQGEGDYALVRPVTPGPTSSQSYPVAAIVILAALVVVLAGVIVVVRRTRGSRDTAAAIPVGDLRQVTDQVRSAEQAPPTDTDRS